MEQPGGAGNGRGTAAAFPGVQADVMMITTGRKECGLMT
jgi:hypothetical protein